MSGQVLGKGPGYSTKKYPECPGPRCWCYDCALDTVGYELSLSHEKDDEKDEEEAKCYIEAKKLAQANKDAYNYTDTQRAFELHKPLNKCSESARKSRAEVLQFWESKLGQFNPETSDGKATRRMVKALRDGTRSTNIACYLEAKYPDKKKEGKMKRQRSRSPLKK